ESDGEVVQLRGAIPPEKIGQEFKDGEVHWYICDFDNGTATLEA
ncbi:hypothetical protein LCGC14_1548250, partial [marine sediment metagenome]